MPTFLPFRALRPSKNKVSEFSAKSTDFKNQEEIIADMLANVQSYYYVTKRVLINNDDENIEYHFSKGAEFLSEKIVNEDLLVDKKPCFYIYRQTDINTNISYIGIIGLSDIEDIEANKIKKHEHTKHQREEYLYKQLHYTGVLGEPVLIGHEQNDELEKIINEITLVECEYDFNSIDNKNHKIWKICNSETLEKIFLICLNIDAFYIADGHHRCASVIRNYKLNPTAGNRFFMTFLLSETQLHIESFHRIISDIGKIELEDFSGKLLENFSIEKYEENKLYIPKTHFEFGILTRDFSLKLKFIKNENIKNPELKLDVSILENYILKPILNIHHPRTDHRLSFISSTENIEKTLKNLKKGNIDLIISNYPMSFNEVKEIADLNKFMPPKSTYIEPKLRGGMIIQKF